MHSKKAFVISILTPQISTLGKDVRHLIALPKLSVRLWQIKLFLFSSYFPLFCPFLYLHLHNCISAFCSSHPSRIWKETLSAPASCTTGADCAVITEAPLSSPRWTCWVVDNRTTSCVGEASSWALRRCGRTHNRLLQSFAFSGVLGYTSFRLQPSPSQALFWLQRPKGAVSNYQTFLKIQTTTFGSGWGKCLFGLKMFDTEEPCMFFEKSFCGWADQFCLTFTRGPGFVSRSTKFIDPPTRMWQQADFECRSLCQHGAKCAYNGPDLLMLFA